MKRVLIIDDDPSIQLLYQGELSEEGYGVISSDGEKGLLQLVVNRKPDLIVLDIKLSNRKGRKKIPD
jgi:DNA-binding response OmpR family regulator